MAMYSTPSTSPAPYTGMMCGSSTEATACDSRRNLARNSWSAARAGDRTFSAASRPSTASRARKTTAIPPAPTCSSITYPASWLPGTSLAITAYCSALNSPLTHASSTARMNPHARREKCGIK